MNTTLTKHARDRMQQRGIPQLVVDCLVRFGRCEPCSDGASKYYLDKKSRHELNVYAGRFADQLSELLDVFVVVGSDSSVITAAHREKRIRKR